MGLLFSDNAQISFAGNLPAGQLASLEVSAVILGTQQMNLLISL